MRAEAPRYAACRRGFTLVEVLLAIVIAGALLVAANFFVLSMGELWGRGSEERLFDQHVRGFTRFLEAFLQQAVVPSTTTGETSGTNGPGLNSGGLPRNRTGSSSWSPARIPAVAPADSDDIPFVRLASASGSDLLFLAQTSPGGRRGPAAPGTGGPTRGGGVPGGGRSGTPGPTRGGAANGASPTNRGAAAAATAAAAAAATDTASADRFGFGTPFGYEGAPSMLMFEVDATPGICVWPHRPLPQVQCALQISADEGLTLLWKSRLEEDFNAARPRKTLLSPFVQGLWYEYYDTDRHEWTRTAQPIVDPGNVIRLPQRFRLLFVYQGMKREVSVALPADLNGPPLR